jgi:hypothetical protein
MHGVLLAAPHKLRLLVGREHGRTVPLPDMLLFPERNGYSRL